MIFNFHGYPVADSPPGLPAHQPQNMHVRGYKEKGNINTPMELAINNEIDRFSLAIDAIDRTPKLQRIGAHAKERFRNLQIDCRNYAHENGIDMPEIVAGDGRIRKDEKAAREGQSGYQTEFSRNNRFAAISIIQILTMMGRMCSFRPILYAPIKAR